MVRPNGGLIINVLLYTYSFWEALSYEINVDYFVTMTLQPIHIFFFAKIPVVQKSFITVCHI